MNILSGKLQFRFWKWNIPHTNHTHYSETHNLWRELHGQGLVEEQRQCDKGGSDLSCSCVADSDKLFASQVCSLALRTSGSCLFFPQLQHFERERMGQRGSQLCSWDKEEVSPIYKNGGWHGSFSFTEFLAECFQLRPEFEDSSLRSCFPVFEVWGSLCCLSWEYIVGPSVVALAICFELRVETPCWSKLWFSGCLDLLPLAKELSWNSRCGFGFASADPCFRLLSWTLFDMEQCFVVGWERKLLKWLQENIQSFMMFTKRRRWFHSSRVNLLFVSMSAIWFWVSTILIWILVSKLILSNRQPSATMWVLDTCLLIGLLPLMIIPITACLSSKMYNWDSPWQEFAFVVT